MIGDEEQQRLRVGRTKVVIDRGELVFLRAAAIQRLQAAKKEHLKRRHERWCLCQVERVEDGGFAAKLQVMQAKIAEVWWHKRSEYALAGALVQKAFAAEQDIAGPPVGRAQFG